MGEALTRLMRDAAGLQTDLQWMIIARTTQSPGDTTQGGLNKKGQPLGALALAVFVCLSQMISSVAGGTSAALLRHPE
jgi:hypothetical protein